ncbi:MAG: type II secretion system protein [Minisyncoccia bacterium]
MTKRLSRGFTLIELLVVIAVIGILASVVMASLNSARAKARDARKIADFKNISTALQLYQDSYGYMPPSYFTYGSNNEAEGGGNYELSMQDLVNAGFLSAIPKSPGGAKYAYYNYSGVPSVGAILVTTLEAAPNSTTGIPPSCRPWTAGTNWCSTTSSKEYCLCHPF